MQEHLLFCEGLERFERSGPLDSYRIMQSSAIRLRKNAEYLLTELAFLEDSCPGLSPGLEPGDKALLDTMVQFTELFESRIDAQRDKVESGAPVRFLKD